jgi:hypothetical protein
MQSVLVKLPAGAPSGFLRWTVRHDEHDATCIRSRRYGAGDVLKWDQGLLSCREVRGGRCTHLGGLVCL